MVTKPLRYRPSLLEGFILAKIHMVTKQNIDLLQQKLSFILAKIHMVTKPQKDDTTRILFDKVLINLFH